MISDQMISEPILLQFSLDPRSRTNYAGPSSRPAAAHYCRQNLVALPYQILPAVMRRCRRVAAAAAMAVAAGHWTRRKLLRLPGGASG